MLPLAFLLYALYLIWQRFAYVLYVRFGIAPPYIDAPSLLFLIFHQWNLIAPTGPQHGHIF